MQDHPRIPAFYTTHNLSDPIHIHKNIYYSPSSFQKTLAPPPGLLRAIVVLENLLKNPSGVPKKVLKKSLKKKKNIKNFFFQTTKHFLLVMYLLFESKG